MPIVKPRIRNSSRNVMLISLIAFVAVGVLFACHEIFIQDFRVCFTDPSLFHLCFGIGTVIILSSLIRLLLVEYFHDGENSAVFLDKFKEHLCANGYLYYLIYLDAAFGVFGLLFHLYMELKFSLVYSISYIFGIISASTLFACMDVLGDYDDVDLSSSQNMEQSIGACWAHGAYIAFYKKILQSVEKPENEGEFSKKDGKLKKDITERMVKFEKEHGIKLLVRKLVIICPLSCNANGSLAGKDGNITKEGSLEVIIEDDGANSNRSLKSNVYKIHGPYEYYISAEIPSPLATLYEMRNVMDSVILNYHRECFVKTLSDLLKSDQCIILEYDDLNSSEPLHSFLLSRLEDKKFVDVI